MGARAWEPSAVAVTTLTLLALLMPSAQAQTGVGLEGAIESFIRENSPGFFDGTPTTPPELVSPVDAAPYNNVTKGGPGPDADLGAVDITHATAFTVDPAAPVPDEALLPIVTQLYDFSALVLPPDDTAAVLELMQRDAADSATREQLATAHWQGGPVPDAGGVFDGSVFPGGQVPDPLTDFWGQLSDLAPQTDRTPLAELYFGPGGVFVCGEGDVGCGADFDATRFADGFTVLGLQAAMELGAKGPGYRHEWVISIVDGSPVYEQPQFLDLFNGTTNSLVLQPGADTPTHMRHQPNCCDQPPFDGLWVTSPNSFLVVLPTDGEPPTAWRGSIFNCPYGGTDQDYLSESTTRPDEAPGDIPVIGPGELVPGLSTPFADSSTTELLGLVSNPTDAPQPPAEPDGDGDGGTPVSEPATTDDGGQLWPGVLVGLGGLALVGGGVLVAVGRRRTTTLADPSVTDDEPDSMKLTDDDLRRLAADIGGGGGVALPTQVGDPTLVWTRARDAEDDVQHRIAQTQARLQSKWLTWHQRFKQAMLGFAQHYLNAWHASEPLRTRQDDWRVHKEAAWAVDLAVSLVMLARGIFTLGRGAIGWVAGRSTARLAAKSADELARLRAAADAAIEANDTVRRFADDFAGAGRAGLKSYREELTDMVMWGQDAGVDVLKIMEDQIQLGKEMGIARLRILDTMKERVITAVAQGLGLVEAAPAVANTVSDALSNAHLLADDAAKLTPEAVQSIQNFVKLVDETPGFFDSLGSMFVRLGRGTDDALTGEVGELVSRDGIEVLRALYASAKAAGDDATKLPGILQETLGPAKVTAMRTVEAAGGVSAGVGPTAAGAAMTGDAVTTDAAAPAQVGTIGSADAYMGQFGISTDSFLGNVWDIFTSPVDTATGLWHSHGAIGELEDLMTNNAVDLHGMAGELATAANAAEHLVDIAEDSDVQGLRDLLEQLDDARQQLQDAYDHAPKDWQDAHGSDYGERMAHIAQKTAAIARMLAAIDWLSQVGRQLAEALRHLQTTPDGDRRTALEMIDPAIAEVLAQVAYRLEGVSYGVTGGGAVGDRPPPSWEEIEAAKDAHIAALDQAAEDVANYDPSTDPDLASLPEGDGQ